MLKPPTGNPPPLLCGVLGCTRFANPATARCFRHDPNTTDEQRRRDEDREHQIERANRFREDS